MDQKPDRLPPELARLELSRLALAMTRWQGMFQNFISDMAHAQLVVSQLMEMLPPDPPALAEAEHRPVPLDGQEDMFRCSCGEVFQSSTGYAVCPKGQPPVSAPRVYIGDTDEGVAGDDRT